MQPQENTYQAIKAIIVYLSNNPDIYMVADNPYFPLARAVMLEGQLGAIIKQYTNVSGQPPPVLYDIH